MDTSALVAALVGDHEHHLLARGHLPSSRLSAIVLAETYSQLRRAFAQPAHAAAALVHPWTSQIDKILPTSEATVAATFARANELDLGGNIHEALIAQVCLEHRLPLATLDARQHRIALAIGVDSHYLLA